MQHQILINVIIFVAYVLNLPLNTLRSHSRSQRAGKWSLIMAHDRRPIYRAPTYIAVPMLGPHQPRYIGLTLYLEKVYILKQALAQLQKEPCYGDMESLNKTCKLTHFAGIGSEIISILSLVRDHFPSETTQTEGWSP